MKSRAISLLMLAVTLAGCSGERPKEKDTGQPRIKLPPGSVVAVECRADLSGDQELFVPEGAVFYRGSLAGVYAVDTAGRLLVRWVRTGRHENGYLAVLSGLDAGERIVGNRVGSLREGVAVEVQVPETKEGSVQ
jgi:hypothetical protein